MAKKKVVASPRNDWDVKRDLGVKRVGFAFDDYNTPAVARRIDYKHLKISTLSTNRCYSLQ
jgi:hypothetical protein